MATPRWRTSCGPSAPSGRRRYRAETGAPAGFLVNVDPMLPPPAAVHHLALLVDDLPAAERFYRDVLGLPVLRRWPDADGGERSVWLDLGGGAFLALERATPGS